MWVFNVWLFLLFVSGPNNAGVYASMVASGSPCYRYMAAWGNDPSPQPVCWYDPTNTNSGK